MLGLLDAANDALASILQLYLWWKKHNGVHVREDPVISKLPLRKVDNRQQIPRGESADCIKLYWGKRILQRNTQVMASKARHLYYQMVCASIHPLMPDLESRHCFIRRNLHRNLADVQNVEEKRNRQDFIDLEKCKAQKWSMLRGKGSQGVAHDFCTITPKKKANGPLYKLDRARDKRIATDRVTVENYLIAKKSLEVFWTTDLERLKIYTI